MVHGSVRNRRVSWGPAVLLAAGGLALSSAVALAEGLSAEGPAKFESYAKYKQAWDSAKDQVDTKRVKALVAALHSENPGARAEALLALEPIAGDEMGFGKAVRPSQKERALRQWDGYARDLERAVAEWAPKLTAMPSPRNCAERGQAAHQIGERAPHVAFLPLLREVVANGDDKYGDNGVRISAIKAISMIRHEGLMEYLIDHLDTDLAFWTWEQLRKLASPRPQTKEEVEQMRPLYNQLNRRLPGEDWQAVKKRYEEWWAKNKATFVYDRQRALVEY
jgi:hypothetical protein